MAASETSEPLIGDFVFGAHAGISALLGSARGRQQSESVLVCQREAVAQAMTEWNEKGALADVIGVGVAPARGLRYSLVEHVEGSYGGPYLHTHALVSSRVELKTGRLSRLDRETFFGWWTAVQVRYLAALEIEAERRLGFAFEDDPETGERRVVGVPDQLLRGLPVAACSAGLPQWEARWRPGPT